MDEIIFTHLPGSIVSISKWAAPFEFYTPPVEDFGKAPQGECKFQVDMLIWHF